MLTVCHTFPNLIYFFNFYRACCIILERSCFIHENFAKKKTLWPTSYKNIEPLTSTPSQTSGPHLHRRLRLSRIGILKIYRILSYSGPNKYHRQLHYIIITVIVSTFLSNKITRMIVSTR